MACLSPEERAATNTGIFLMSFTTLVSTAELAANLDNPDWVIFDCRFTLTDATAGRESYHECHIPGAIYAHLDDDLAAPVDATSGRHPLPDVDVLSAKLGQWGVDQKTQVVVYDDAFGAMACRMWWLLRWLGHDNVALLDGVYPKWCREKRPTDKTPAKTQARRFVANVQAELVVEADFVMAHLANKTGPLIDARPDVRFTGEVEPIDKVAGHIPGATNRPFDDNLNIGGDFLPIVELKEEFSSYTTHKDPSKIIHMCGSGVTACHNILAMEHIGIKGTRLFVGSWSQWITDPDRNTTVGE